MPVVVPPSGVAVSSGAYLLQFVDQVQLAGTTGGSTTSFSLTYVAQVFAKPIFTITIPASNPATISKIVLTNTMSGEALTINFAAALSASTAYTLTIDSGAMTVKDQNANAYDATGSFPRLYGPANQANTFTCVVTTGTGTASGMTLDTTWTNRWLAKVEQ